jgi:heat shock protein HslJ
MVLSNRVMKKLLLLILGIFMLMICFAGCTSQPATPTPVSTPTPVATQLPAVSQPIATQSPIVGVWDLSSYNNGKGAIQTVIPGSQTTADFRADWKLSGTGGCNQYNAEYTTTASNGITITQPITTLMACAEPVMQQETQYLSLLPTAAKYEISGDQLTMYNSAGTKILIYKKHAPVPLTGTWNLFNYNNGKGAIQSVMIGSTTNAVFGSNWKLSGTGGCNQYNAEYTTTASNGITITQPTSTKMACAEAVMQQETQYFSLLPTAAKYEISGDQLTLFNATGTKILIYKSAGLKVNPL